MQRSRQNQAPHPSDPGQHGMLHGWMPWLPATATARPDQSGYCRYSIFSFCSPDASLFPVSIITGFCEGFNYCHAVFLRNSVLGFTEKNHVPFAAHGSHALSDYRSGVIIEKTPERELPHKSYSFRSSPDILLSTHPAPPLLWFGEPYLRGAAEVHRWSKV